MAQGIRVRAHAQVVARGRVVGAMSVVVMVVAAVMIVACPEAGDAPAMSAATADEQQRSA